MNDTVLLSTGMKILIKNLGVVEAERFICLTKRDTVNYTEFRHTLFKDMTLEEICQGAAEAKQRADDEMKNFNT